MIQSLAVVVVQVDVVPRQLLAPVPLRTLGRRTQALAVLLLVLLLRLQLLLLLLLQLGLLLAGGREGVLQQGGMRSPVSGM